MIVVQPESSQLAAGPRVFVCLWVWRQMCKSQSQLHWLLLTLKPSPDPALSAPRFGTSQSMFWAVFISFPVLLVCFAVSCFLFPSSPICCVPCPGHQSLVLSARLLPAQFPVSHLPAQASPPFATLWNDYFFAAYVESMVHILLTDSGLQETVSNELLAFIFLPNMFLSSKVF